MLTFFIVVSPVGWCFFILFVCFHWKFENSKRWIFLQFATLHSTPWICYGVIVVSICLLVINDFLLFANWFQKVDLLSSFFEKPVIFSDTNDFDGLDRKSK